MNEKDRSLLEIAVEMMAKQKKPITLYELGRITAEEKGLKRPQAVELLPQFFCDVMASGIFVYCGNDLWDLKERQPISLLETDVADFESNSEFGIEADLNKMGQDDNDFEDEEDNKSFESDEPDDIESELNKESSKESSLEDDNVELGYQDEDEEDIEVEDETTIEEKSEEDILDEELKEMMK